MADLKIICSATTKTGSKCTLKSVDDNLKLCKVHLKIHEKKISSENVKSTITITFGDCAENHVGMEKLTSESSNNARQMSVETLKNIKKTLSEKGIVCDLFDLAGPTDKCAEAAVLVIKNGVKVLFDISPKDLMEEQLALEWDTKALQRGKVVNKHARYNLCFTDGPDRDPSISEGKGRIYSFNSLPLLGKIKKNLHIALNSEEAKNLVAEGNYYYNSDICGIGFHGDAERKIVIAIRLGENLPLLYSWYKDSEMMSEECYVITPEEGDIYIMSEKAVGTDWKKRLVPTLRHATGGRTFLSKLGVEIE